jgi:GNAT superfamily N-acetyltransferase
MTQFLDIHLANDDERRAAHENCHDVWSQGLPLAAHVAHRECSALHQSARWAVGCLDGRVVAALASHPLRFRWHGRSYPGIGIASVHTLREIRGLGFAQRMIRWIEPFERQHGARLSVLFCDIDPRYYARLGYTLCPSHSGWASTASIDLPHVGNDGWRLQPAEKTGTFAAQIAAFAEIYNSDHARRAFSVERTTDYWQHLADRLPEAERFWFVSPAGDRCGYVWLRTETRDVVIDDHAVRDGVDANRSILLRAVVKLAAQRGLARAGGWLPAVPLTDGLFGLEPRTTEITMLKSLDEAVVLDQAAIAACDWLQEIDHV